MNNTRTLIFVPTYNERENVERLCLELLDLDIEADILFLDDNSPDGTGQIMDRLATEHENVYLIHRGGKLGIGSAHQDGINWAYDRGYKTLVTMDCDFTHRPQDLPEFLRKSKDFDVVLGSRYIQSESLRDWTFFRKAMTSLGHFLTTTLLRMKYDATGAFRAYRLDRIPRETFARVRSTSYSFFFESLYALNVNGHTIGEVPITLSARTYGHSKMRASDAVGSLVRLMILASTQFVSSRYSLPRTAPPNPAEMTDEVAQNQAWDEYWLKPKSPLFRIYGGIASLYRKYLIKRNLDRLLTDQFPQYSRLLHAGCGSGQVDTDVTGEHSVVAFDLSAPALKIYERVHTDPHDLVRGTIFSIPIKNSSLDGIYHLGVMEHFAEQEIQQILSEFHRILKPGGKMVVFWPPKFGLSVGVLTLVHFVLNRILRRGVKLHPDEITLLRSRSHAVELFARARFAVDGYSFGINDFFTYCMVVVSKLPETIIIDDESVAAD